MRLHRQRVSLLIVGLTSSAFAQTSPTTQPFHDKDSRFEFVIPIGWKETVPTPKYMSVDLKSAPETAPDPFIENFSVQCSVHENGVPGNVDSVVSKVVAGAKEQFRATLQEDVKTITLDGHEGRRFVLLFTVKGKHYRVQQTYVYVNDTMFIITYTAITDTAKTMDDAIQAIFDSWKFLPAR